MLGDVNKHFVFKCLLTTPSNVLPLHLKQTFSPMIWIFNEGEGHGIESSLPFKRISTFNWFGQGNNIHNTLDFCPYILWFLLSSLLLVVTFQTPKMTCGCQILKNLKRLWICLMTVHLWYSTSKKLVTTGKFKNTLVIQRSSVCL